MNSFDHDDGYDADGDAKNNDNADAKHEHHLPMVADLVCHHLFLFLLLILQVMPLSLNIETIIALLVKR